MTDSSEVERLEGWLLEGLSAVEVASLCPEVAEGEVESEGIEDARILRVLAERLDARASAALRVAAEGSRAAEPEEGLGEAVRSVDASLPARLGRPGDGVAIEAVTELTTLLLVLRGGGLAQRRAALERIAELLATEGRRGRGSEAIRKALACIESVQDPALAWVRHRSLLRIGGAQARVARMEAERRARLFQEALRRARQWWEGEGEPEPVTAMPGDERARLLLWLREAPDELSSHVAALLEGGEPSLRHEERLSLLSACRYTGDSRLTASLITVLRVEGGGMVAEAGRALASIRDPRVLPALRKAFDRSVLETTRAALAGALGELGDARGLELVRSMLDGEEPARVQAALAALEHLGLPEDAERVVPWLSSPDPALRLQAVRALGRIGDARALDPLLGVLSEPDLPPGLRRVVEEALDAVRARMDLRGEETVSLPLLGERASMLLPAAGEESGPEVGWTARCAARWRHGWGKLWERLGARERALRLFEEAAHRWPRWVAPRLSAARLQARMGRYGLALASFRLALEADRRAVESSASAMEALVQAFLRRAEEVERDGRREVARGLVDEVRALDLRRVPGSLRFEIERRAEDLRLWLGEGEEEAVGQGREGSR